MSEPAAFADNSAFDTTYVDAIAIAGCVMAALIALVVLRFLVNFLIDWLILGELGSARRTIGGLVRRICPWWHRRTEPQATPTTTNEQGRLEMDTLGRDRTQRKVMIESILPYKVSDYCIINRIWLAMNAYPSSFPRAQALSVEDLENLRRDHAAQPHLGEECGKGLCSICLVEFGEYTR